MSAKPFISVSWKENLKTSIGHAVAVRQHFQPCNKYQVHYKTLLVIKHDARMSSIEVRLDRFENSAKEEIQSQVNQGRRQRYGRSGHGRTTFLGENCFGRITFSAEYDLFFIFSAELSKLFHAVIKD